MNDELKIKNNELGGKMNYRYRTDEEMKDSGVEWLGKIPKEWIISKFKYFYTFGMGETILKENLSDNGLPVYSATEEDSVFGKYNNAKLILKEGDIIIPARGNSIGAVKIAKDKCTCTQTTIYGKKIGTINEKFIYYFMKGNRNHLFYFDQTAIPQITTNQVKENMLVYGDMVIQDKIAKFLDEKTAQFDSIISKKEALIEKLEEAKKSLISEVVTGKVKVVKTNDGYELVERKKEEMKDSGVEWLGDIPKEWLVKRIKYLLMECRGKSEEGLEEPLSMSQKYGLIKTSDMDNIPNQALSLVGNKIVCKNDLVFNKLKPHLGVFSVSKYNGIVSPDYAVYRAKEKVNIKYLEYLFKTPLYIREFKKYATGIGAGLTRLYTDQLFNIQAISPSYSEQENIVIMINRKLEETNMAIEKMKNQIEKLKEAKQSLISEAVTGKIEIL